MSYIHRNSASLHADGGVIDSTARNCLDMVDRAIDRMEIQQAQARKDRAEFRALLKAGKVDEIIPSLQAGRPTKITPAIRARVISARLSGMGIVKIAQQEGIGSTTAARIIYRARREAAAV